MDWQETLRPPRLAEVRHLFPTQAIPQRTVEKAMTRHPSAPRNQRPAFPAAAIMMAVMFGGWSAHMAGLAEVPRMEPSPVYSTSTPPSSLEMPR